jgi:hypothetical protein
MCEWDVGGDSEWVHGDVYGDVDGMWMVTWIVVVWMVMVDDDGGSDEVNEVWMMVMVDCEWVHGSG